MTSPTDTPLNKKSKIPWYVYFVGALCIPLLPVGCSEDSPIWHGFASSVRRWGFSMPGELGNERNETEMSLTALVVAARSAIAAASVAIRAPHGPGH